jgi:hypothetical protein
VHCLNFLGVIIVKNKNDYSRYRIEEIIAEISRSKDGKSPWGKYILKCSFEDTVPTIDIRHMAFKEDGTHVIGKGISLNNEETDGLTDSLVTHGYGHTNVLEEELQKRKKMYGFHEDKGDSE